MIPGFFFALLIKLRTVSSVTDVVSNTTNDANPGMTKLWAIKPIVISSIQITSFAIYLL